MAERAGAAPRLPLGFEAWVAAVAVSDAGVAALYVALGWAATSYGGTAAGLVVATITATRTLLLLLLVGGAVARWPTGSVLAWSCCSGTGCCCSPRACSLLLPSCSTPRCGCCSRPRRSRAW